MSHTHAPRQRTKHLSPGRKVRRFKHRQERRQARWEILRVQLEAL